MANRSLGTLTLDLIAKVGGFEQGLDKAGRSAEKRMKQISDSAAKLGAAVGAGLAAGVTALGAITVSAIKSATEVAKLASVANVSTTDFQKLASGARLVGVEQDKLSDILKDVNDKVGDFLNTGGGEMKDFFEQIAPKVGVTADQFRNLSGSQALGLYVSSLEKAKVSQSDMTFYMEAIANDATLLLPLLRNNSEGFKRFGDAAEAAGAIMDEKTVRAAKELQAANWLVDQSISGITNQLTAALLPSMAEFAGRLSDSSINGVVAKKVADDLAASLQALAKFAIGTVAGIHLLGVGLKSLSDFDNAMVGGEDAKWWDRYLPPVRIYNAFKNIDAMGNVIGGTKEHMDSLITGYGDLMASFDSKTGGSGSKNQVKELADLLDRLKTSGPGTFTAITRAQQDAAKAAEAAAKKLQGQFDTTEQDYQRQIALINTEVDKRKDATEVAKLQFELESGKLSGLSVQQQDRLKGLAAELDQLKKIKQENEDAKKLAAFRANVGEDYQTARSGFDQDLAGAGRGDKYKERLKERLAIEEDFNRQQRELVLQRNSGDISAELYAQETEVLSEALAARLVLQQDYYNQVDEAQSNWMDGVTSAWENFADAASNYSALAADATTSTLGSAKGELSSFLSDVATGSKDAGDALVDMITGFAKSGVQALSDMASQWLVYQAVQLIVGKTTQSTAGLAMVANAQATAFQASLAAFASTAAIPIVGPALAPAAAAAAAATTAPMVAGVASSALMGMAHDGIDNIPREGTWLLDGGERVLNPNQNRDLTHYLRSANEAGGGMGRGGGITINAPVTVQAQPGMSDEAARRQGEMMGQAFRQTIREVVNEEFAQGGSMWRR
ncbi:phage tail tape measure protein [Pseudomonas sp. NBRC 111142]|uniref:phage tail tape measure protein n=1 Tax=Pseudomonas sp. NBRC 111142 TaxID=1661057 RepID=UPI0006D4119D|nr:phage tail tape measure protein [Pseudomonas sp. NBRC 111142]